MSAERRGQSFTVRGRVQGVGFRWFVRETATALGLVGWVANRADGSVQGEVWGAPETVGKFVHALMKGPPGANVTRVEGTDASSEPPDSSSFEIRQ